MNSEGDDLRGEQPAPEAGSAAPREGLGCVVGIAFGLALIGAAFASALSFGPSVPEPRALLAERFELGELPVGIQPLESMRLAGGELLVRLCDPTLEPLEPGERPPDRAGGGPPGGGGAPMHGASGEGPPAFDWTSLPEGAAGTPAREVVVVWYPRGMAEGVLRREFSGLRFDDPRKLPEAGGACVLDAGQLPWGDFTTGFVRERLYERAAGEPRFRDVLRVNLSLGARCCVLYAAWPPGEVGGVEPLRALLDALGPRPPAAADR